MSDKVVGTVTAYGRTFGWTTERAFDENVPVSPQEQVRRYESLLHQAQKKMEFLEVYSELPPNTRAQLKDLAGKGHETDADPKVVQQAYEKLYDFHGASELYLIMHDFLEEKFPGYPLKHANQRAAKAVASYYTEKEE